MIKIQSTVSVIIKKIILVLILISCTVVYFYTHRVDGLIPENPRLERVIRKQLGKKHLTEQDLEEVTRLFINAKYGSAKKLEGIERLKNLKSLILYPGKIKNLEPITKINHLTYLCVNRNPVSSYEPISKCIYLKGLDLCYQKNVDLKYLENLTELKDIDLGMCNLDSIDELKNLNPERVILWNNNISCLPDLSGWTNIKEVYVGCNPIAQNHDIIDENNRVRMSYFGKFY